MELGQKETRFELWKERDVGDVSMSVSSRKGADLELLGGVHCMDTREGNLVLAFNVTHSTAVWS